MSVDRGENLQPNSNLENPVGRSLPREERRVVLDRLNRRLTRRGVLKMAGVVLGAGFLGTAGRSAYQNRDKLMAAINAPRSGEQKAATFLDRKNVDVRDKNELHPVAVEDLKTIVRTVIKPEYQGGFKTVLLQEEDKLSQRLLSGWGSRISLEMNPGLRTESVESFKKAPGYQIRILADLDRLKSDMQYPGFSGDYVSETDLTLRAVELYGELPLQDITEVKSVVKSAKMSNGLGVLHEIPMEHIPKAFKAVVNLNFLMPGSLTEWYSGAQWGAEGARASDGARVVMGVGRNGQFRIRIEDNTYKGRPGESRWAETGAYYSHYAKGDPKKDRSNMSVEGWGGIPSEVAYDAIGIVKALLKEPFQGSIPADSNIESPNTDKLVRDFQIGNRLYVFGTEDLGLAPLPANRDTPEARRARERPWYSLHFYNSKRLARLNNGFAEPSLDIKYKSNTDITSPVQVVFSGQLPFGEMESVKGMVVPSMLADGRKYSRVPVDEIPKGFKEAFDLSYLKSGSFRSKFEVDRWRATGVREADGSSVEFVVAPDGRFAVLVRDKDYRPESDENIRLEVPDRPKAR